MFDCKFHSIVLMFFNQFCMFYFWFRHAQFIVEYVSNFSSVKKNKLFSFSEPRNMHLSSYCLIYK